MFLLFICLFLLLPFLLPSSFSLSHPHDSPLRLQAAFGGWGPTLQLMRAESMLGARGWVGSCSFPGSQVSDFCFLASQLGLIHLQPGWGCGKTNTGAGPPQLVLCLPLRTPVALDMHPLWGSASSFRWPSPNQSK